MGDLLTLAYLFFIGMFFGIFIIDVAHSAQLVLKLKKFAEENQLVLKYETIKTDIRNMHMATSSRYHFFSPFHTATSLTEYLKGRYGNKEKHKKEHKE